MIPEIGHFALTLALATALVQGIVPLWGAACGNPGWMLLARSAACAQFLFVGLALACLGWAFAANDFTVTYIAANSSTALPVTYRLSAIWAGNQGSLLLWGFILALWSFALSRFSRHLPLDMLSRVLGVMGLLGAGFLGICLFVANPFVRGISTLIEGRGINPLLQDPAMLLHPPLLYLGYVGLSVVFAFTVAALIGGRLDAAWARWSRPWVMLAWLFLTLGIALGSWWAYYETGWGGWWFWDPVENAALIPWLLATALIHALAVTEKRASFRIWTALLAILAFSVALLGAYLVRSGSLSSVHTFASDPERGVFILALLIPVAGGALALFAIRAPRVGPGGRFMPLSRESLLLFNNVLLTVAAASVLLGTLYPLLLEALSLGRISVGPAYFELVLAPVMLSLLVLMGVAPLVRWKHDHGRQLARRLAPAAIASALAALLVAGHGETILNLTTVGFGAAFWIAIGTTLAALDRIRIGAPVPLAFWGMCVAHLGVAVLVFGISVVKTHESQAELKMHVGETARIGAYTFLFGGVEPVEGPNYTASRAELLVSRDGRPETVLRPERRIYRVQRMQVTEAAIDGGLSRHLFAALGEPVGKDAWIVRIHHKPLVGMIWVGGLLMAAGGLLAAVDRRYRRLGQLPADRGVRPGPGEEEAILTNRRSNVLS